MYTLELDLIPLGCPTQQQQPVQNQSRSLSVRVNTICVYDLIHAIKLESSDCDSSFNLLNPKIKVLSEIYRVGLDKQERTHD